MANRCRGPPTRPGAAPVLRRCGRRIGRCADGWWAECSPGSGGFDRLAPADDIGCATSALCGSLEPVCFAGLTICGAVLGAVWAWIAPPPNARTRAWNGSAAFWAGNRINLRGRGDDDRPVVLAVVALVWLVAAAPGAHVIGRVVDRLAAVPLPGVGAAWRVTALPADQNSTILRAPVTLGHHHSLAAVTLVLPSGVGFVHNAFMAVATADPVRDDLALVSREELLAEADRGLLVSRRPPAHAPGRSRSGRSEGSGRKSLDW